MRPMDRLSAEISALGCAMHQASIALHKFGEVYGRAVEDELARLRRNRLEARRKR